MARRIGDHAEQPRQHHAGKETGERLPADQHEEVADTSVETVAPRLDQAQRDKLIRGFLPKRFREAGLIARTDDRGDAVMQIAPPLISDAALLDEIVDRLGEVLTDAGRQIGVAEPALTA